MHEKSLAANRAATMEAPAARSPRRKRIDLVVTDHELTGELAGLCGADGLQSEFRCTIPVAIVDGDIPRDALREVARVCRPLMNDPINEQDFLRLIAFLFGSLKQQAGQMPADGPLPQ